MKRISVLLVLIAMACIAVPVAAWQPKRQSGNAPNGGYRATPERQWELLFDDGITSEEYALRLDHFGIEIGVVSKTGKIESISNVTRYKPDKHESHVDREYRLQIVWKTGTLHATDRRLLRKAGIGSNGKELVHYFPVAVQKEMEDLEADYAGRKPREIRRTRFRIRPKTTGKGYEFAVIEQDPPKPGNGASKPRSAGPPSER
jgi:hypothetical protein